MFLQRAFPPPSKGNLKSIFDLKQPLNAAYDQETVMALDWIRSNPSPISRFTQSVTIIAAWPTPVAAWIAPANISVYPCGDHSVVIIAYMLNQRAYQIGNCSVESTLAAEGHMTKQKFSSQCESYIHAHIRVFPATVEWTEGRDHMRKHPPFYEVSLTCMSVNRMRAWHTTTRSIVGDWLRDYCLGKKTWNGHSVNSQNSRKEQCVIWNDQGHTRRTCALSSSKYKHMKDRAWIMSTGTQIQGSSPTILEVSASHDQFAHSLLARQGNVDAPTTFCCRNNSADERLP
jgi:hypothetical protein